MYHCRRGGNRIFTGIVEELGTIQHIKPGSRSFRITINATKVLEQVKLGDSIAVNGVCLTVVDFSQNSFTCDVMPETYQMTTLKYLNAGSSINLERALRLTDRLGGHLVQGHVDGIGTILEKHRYEIAIIYKFKADPHVLKYIVPRGSIAVDGVSLTVIEVTNENFTVSLIPHTAGLTTLGIKREGDKVNLESDIIGRYIEKLLNSNQGIKTNEQKGLSLSLLAENGFV